MPGSWRRSGRASRWRFAAPGWWPTAWRRRRRTCRPSSRPKASRREPRRRPGDQRTNVQATNDPPVYSRDCFPLQRQQNGRRTADCHARDILHEELFDDTVADDHGETSEPNPEIGEILRQPKGLSELAFGVGDEIDGAKGFAAFGPGFDHVMIVHRGADDAVDSRRLDLAGIGDEPRQMRGV